MSKHRVRLGITSLVIGPALMSVGDILHPPENWDPAVQVAILADSATWWYFAHLLLLVGMLLFVPGILELTRLAALHRPRAGYAARVLMLVSVGALSAVFAFEVLLGRFITDGADQATAVALLKTFQSAAVFAALAPGLFAFFIGTGLLVWSLYGHKVPFRGPSLLLGLGAILILGEIIFAQVLLSQIGNILVLASGVAFARLLRVEDHSR